MIQNPSEKVFIIHNAHWSQHDAYNGLDEKTFEKATIINYTWRKTGYLKIQVIC